MKEDTRLLLDLLQNQPGNWDLRRLIVNQLWDEGLEKEAARCFLDAPQRPDNSPTMLLQAKLLVSTSPDVSLMLCDQVEARGHITEELERIRELARYSARRSTAIAPAAPPAAMPHPVAPSVTIASMMPPVEVTAFQTNQANATPVIAPQISVANPVEKAPLPLLEPDVPAPVLLLEDAAFSDAGPQELPLPWTVPPQPIAEDKRKRSGLWALGWAVLAHAVVIFLAALLLIAIREQPLPEITVSLPGKEDPIEPYRPTIVPPSNQTPASASMAATPRLLASTVAAPITIPTIEIPVTELVSLGAGTMGISSGLTSGLGRGRTGMFGSMTGSPGALEGMLYDLKQNTAGRPSSIAYESPAGYGGVVQQIVSRSFGSSAFSGIYRAPQKLFLSQLLIPYTPAEKGPAAFRAEKEVQPRGWLVHYSGMIAAPESGEYRWVGCSDDLLLVSIERQVVLDASWERPFVSASQWKPPSGRSRPGIASQNLQEGSWVTLEKGRPKRIDILVGERPGGYFFAALLIEKKGGTYKKDGSGHPILPPFSLGTLNEYDKDRLRAAKDGSVKFQIELDNVPRFAP
jgi:hypothetical protein